VVKISETEPVKLCETEEDQKVLPVFDLIFHQKNMPRWLGNCSPIGFNMTCSTTSSQLWELKYRISLLFGTWRAGLWRMMGLLENPNGKSVAIGAHSLSFFESGAKIVISEPDLTPAPNNAPLDFNANYAALGLMNPRRYQNPPSRTSRFRLEKGSKIILGQHSRVGPGFYFSLGINSNLSIGSWTYIGSDFQAFDRVGIQVGRKCMISHSVTLMDYDGHYLSYEGMIQESAQVGNINIGRGAEIVIEDNVWIGTNVTILKGVRVGEGSVVASGAVVTRSIPKYSLVAGNPSAVVKTGVEWRHF